LGVHLVFDYYFFIAYPSLVCSSLNCILMSSNMVQQNQK